MHTHIWVRCDVVTNHLVRIHREGCNVKKVGLAFDFRGLNKIRYRLDVNVITTWFVKPLVHNRRDKQTILMHIIYCLFCEKNDLGIARRKKQTANVGCVLFDQASVTW